MKWLKYSLPLPTAKAWWPVAGPWIGSCPGGITPCPIGILPVTGWSIGIGLANRPSRQSTPEPADFFSTVDLILHSGDVTAPSVLDWLEQFAPVRCTRGNNDPLPDGRTEDVKRFEAEGWRIGMVNSLVP